MIENVHTRELAVPARELAPLIDGLSGPHDALWPAPPWPAMLLDRPLGPGADGGHGPIRYTCSAHVPGRQVEFAFAPATGFGGTHGFTVLEGPDPQRCVLRHVLYLEPLGVAARLRWSLVVRWLHDALIEDALDRAATAVGQPPVTPARWSPWVRVLTAVLVSPRAPRLVTGALG